MRGGKQTQNKKFRTNCFVKTKALTCTHTTYSLTHAQSIGSQSITEVKQR